MTYPEQLDTIQWKSKRLTILKRDGYKCQNCLNEKLTSELDKGLFAGYCFPNSKEAIHIDNFGTDNNMRAGIKDGYAQYIHESTVIYSRKVPKWRRMVLGVRKLDSLEKNIFDKYAKKNIELNKEFRRNFNNYEDNTSVITKILEEKENRRIEFTKLNIEKKNSNYEWIFMLGLHIHHKYYINQLFAWEYKDDALITLCETCHRDLHEKQEVQVYNNEYELIGKYKYCSRCHGAGVFPEYSHVDNGICFRCKGIRYEELIN
ncbi:hypothetical protein ES692_17415 [Psychroserpens burtonensis]|uniref:Uncharacterized protein n=1 Tax=Psychroserpens burtonensis TaxID=49278 RepID=A0A5C7BBH6_9FLAO|nr:hypothetical protein [Psychroserpens burtonensis]TXE15274.1 hypothetical protein ES692_17415 [Psychroserpens burtonensis]